MFKRLNEHFIYNEKVKIMIPSMVKKMIYRHFSLLDTRTIIAKKKNYGSDINIVSNYSSDYTFRLGIIKEMRYNHANYIRACKELGVNYKVIDISGADWIENVKKSACDAFLVHPSVVVSVWKEMYDERINIIANELNKIVYPTFKELWIYENKRRVQYWLKANRFAHPHTYIFYDMQSTLNFAQEVNLPIIFKSISSSGARGVKLFRSRKALISFIKKYFRKGFLPDYHEKMDKEWGCFLFQEYLPNVREWRIIRIGDSYFGYEKLSVKNFHSGSGKWRYLRPPDNLLNLCKKITDKGGFTSMSIDIFETSDGRLLINELQTYFGTQYKKEMCVVDNKAGRMIYKKNSNSWHFEEGSFCQNNLCNLRVKVLIDMLAKSKPKDIRNKSILGYN